MLGIIRADDLDHAIAIQNDSEFGLTAGLQALDPAEVERWLDRVEAGNVYVNRGITGAIVQRQPFGGWKRSSVGADRQGRRTELRRLADALVRRRLGRDRRRGSQRFEQLDGRRRSRRTRT